MRESRPNPSSSDPGTPSWDEPDVTPASLTPPQEPSIEHEVTFEEVRRSIGRYNVIRKLGEGGMGLVLVAYDQQLEREVAIKLVKDERRGSTHKRMIREAQAMARLSHPNVVPVFEVGEHEGQLYIAMEYVKGQTLKQWQEREDRSWQDILTKYIEGGRGLAAAHAEGMVHRDFKPQNAMVGRDDRVRVLDFGLAARDATHDNSDSAPAESAPSGLDINLTKTGAMVGTPAYMAPEQFKRGATDHRTDQFSFCVSLWEAVYGQRPFPGDVVAAIFLRIAHGNVAPVDWEKGPPWLPDVLRRGLSFDPAERWPDLPVLLDELERKRHEVVPRRRAWAWPVVGLSLGAAAVGIALLQGMSNDATEKPEASVAASTDLARSAVAPAQAEDDRAREVKPGAVEPRDDQEADRAGSSQSVPQAEDPSAAGSTIEETSVGAVAPQETTNENEASAAASGSAKRKAKTSPKPKSARSKPLEETRPLAPSNDARTELSQAKKAAKKCGKDLGTLIPEATVKVKVGADGGVDRVLILPPAKGTPEGACLETAISRLSLPNHKGSEVQWKLKLY